MAIDETSSPTQEPREIRARRAVVVAGVGLVWMAFMAALGLFALAGIAAVVTAVVAAMALGARLPSNGIGRAAGRVSGATAALASGTARGSRSALVRVRSASTTAARTGGEWRRRLSAEAVRTGRSGARGIATAVRTTVGGATVTASTARRRLEQARQAPASRLARESAQLRKEGRIDEAVEVAEEAVSRFDTDGDLRGRALASNSLGIALAKAGRHEEAIDAFDAAVALLAEAGDRHHEGQVLANLGAVHRRVGGTEAARFCWIRALERLEPGTREAERTAELLGAR
jgi:Tetratricopeptide repeat